MGRSESTVEVLVRFARLASSAAGPADVMPLLTRAAFEHLGTAAAVLRVAEADQVRLVASHGLPASLFGWQAEAETIGSELGDRLLAACGGLFHDVRVLPLVSSRDLYGVLVLLSASHLAADPARDELAQALADLAALAMGKAAQMAELERSYRELRSSREALAGSEKLRALGSMAASVSHDLGNLLNPLGLEIEVMRRRAADSAAVLEGLERMREAVRVGVDNLERLRNFSRQSPERTLEPTDPNRVAETALHLAGARLGQRRDIQVRRELGAPPLVGAHVSELVTAVVNLLLNATDAMADSGGVITVRTGESEGGGWIEVADDGPGMPPEVEARVFEPFFTTRSEGTGLGLAMVYAAVGRQRGRLTLVTAPGQGARFRMWFPAAGE